MRVMWVPVVGKTMHTFQFHPPVGKLWLGQAARLRTTASIKRASESLVMLETAPPESIEKEAPADETMARTSENEPRQAIVKDVDAKRFAAQHKAAMAVLEQEATVRIEDTNHSNCPTHDLIGSGALNGFRGFVLLKRMSRFGTGLTLHNAKHSNSYIRPNFQVFYLTPKLFHWGFPTRPAFGVLIA